MDGTRVVPETAADKDPWREALRREARLGEEQVATLRLGAVVVFYANELVNYHVLGVVDAAFHRQVTGVASVWVAFALACRVYLWKGGTLRDELTYLFSTLDIALLTVLLAIGSGPKSPLLILYYVVIGLSSFRYSMPLTAFNTALCALAYGGLFAWARQRAPDMVVPAHTMVIYLLGMVVTGFSSGYVVARLKKVTGDFVANMVRRQKVEGTFSRYVSHQVAQKILENVDSLEDLKSERRRVTVMMTDIRGFTPLCERLSPEEVVALLNDYFSLITRVIFEHDGTIDKFIGDAVLVVFGAPVDQPDSPAKAVQCAARLQRELAAFNEARDRDGLVTVRMGMALHFGDVVAGNVDSSQRLEYTILGDTVNLTQRLCSAAGPGQTLISGEVYRNVQDRVDAKELEPLHLKGKHRPVQAYELVAMR